MTGGPKQSHTDIALELVDLERYPITGLGPGIRGQPTTVKSNVNRLAHDG